MSKTKRMINDDLLQEVFWYLLDKVEDELCRELDQHELERLNIFTESILSEVTDTIDNFTTDFIELLGDIPI